MRQAKLLQELHDLTVLFNDSFMHGFEYKRILWLRRIKYLKEKLEKDNREKL